MDLNNVLKIIKENFSPRKNIDFEEEGLHFELEPLNTKEETIVLEACKDIDETLYIENLKRYSLACSIKKINNLDFSKDDIEYEDKDDDNKVKTKSKFLFMKDYLAKWPSVLIDILFDAFTNMQREIENKIRTNAKFEKFAISEEPEEQEEKPGELRKIVENEAPDIELTETEKLNKKVEKELDTETIRMAEKELDAETVQKTERKTEVTKKS